MSKFLFTVLLLTLLSWQVQASVNFGALYAVAPAGDGDAPEDSVNKDIVTLVKLSEKNPNRAKQALKKLSATLIVSLNSSEQYLFYVAQANIAKHENNHQRVITLLKKALALSDKVPDKLLSTPLFFNAHFTLAESYAAVGDYDAAYEHKKQFFLKYQDDYIRRNNELVAALNKKYEIERKAQENALLEQQNKLEQIEIAQVEKLQQENQRNTLIIGAVAVIFILLMLRQYRVRKQLLILARTDALTGLVNRKTLFYLGNKLVKKAKEQQRPLSTILFDADFFKKINDTYGHQAGDKVLLVLAQLGNEVLRSRDVFARIGGEEFVILLPDETIERAKAVAEHLREKIANYDFSAQEIDTQVTASFGVATLTASIDDFDALIAAADMAMYQAKSQGRNQVVCYNNSFSENPHSNIRATQPSQR